MVVAALIAVAAACTSGDAPATARPTRDLIIFTPTFTPTPITPTPQNTPLPAPGDILTATAAANAVSPDDQAARLAAANLATGLAVAESAIQVVAVEPRTWDGREIACDTPETPLQQIGTAGYQVLLLLDDVVHTYRVVDAEVRQCDSTPLDEVNPDVYILVDLVAGELVALGQRRIGVELNLPTRRIRLLEIEPVVWEDVSLGCQRGGATAAPLSTNGYRFVLAAGENEYEFHTSFDTITLCETRPLQTGDGSG